MEIFQIFKIIFSVCSSCKMNDLTKLHKRRYDLSKRLLRLCGFLRFITVSVYSIFSTRTIHGSVSSPRYSIRRQSPNSHSIGLGARLRLTETCPEPMLKNIQSSASSSKIPSIDCISPDRDSREDSFFIRRMIGASYKFPNRILRIFFIKIAPQ